MFVSETDYQVRIDKWEFYSNFWIDIIFLSTTSSKLVFVSTLKSQPLGLLYDWKQAQIKNISNM